MVVTVFISKCKTLFCITCLLLSLHEFPKIVVQKLFEYKSGNREKWDSIKSCQISFKLFAIQKLLFLLKFGHWKIITAPLLFSGGLHSKINGQFISDVIMQSCGLFIFQILLKDNRILSIYFYHIHVSICSNFNQTEVMNIILRLGLIPLN